MKSSEELKQDLDWLRSPEGRLQFLKKRTRLSRERYVHNLYLDPKERRPFGIRTALITKQLQAGQKRHKATFKAYPPKILMTLE